MAENKGRIVKRGNPQRSRNIRSVKRRFLNRTPNFSMNLWSMVPNLRKIIELAKQ